MAVPYTFGTATSSIPLSQLDSNFATGITLGNTTVYLGNTTTSFGNVTLTNVTISSVAAAITPSQGGTGLVTIPANNVMLGNGTANVTVVAPGTTGNVLTSNGTTWTSATISAASVSAAGSTTQVQYNNAGAFAGSANLTFNGTTLTAAGLSGPLNGTVGATTPSTGAFTTLSASSTVSGTGFSTYLASPPAIGGTAPAAGAFTTLTASTAIGVASGGTGLTTTPANGALDIGNGTGFTRTTLTQGSGITITNGAGSITIASSGGTPGGSSGQVQYNSSGSFAGSSNFNYDGSRLLLGLSSNLSGARLQTQGATDTGLSALTINASTNDGYMGIGYSSSGSVWQIWPTYNATAGYKPLAFVVGGSEVARFPTATGFQCVNSISVGNATPTTSGAGITFPATQSASTDANTLDDYEEGTWTPSVGGTATYNELQGYYVKVGKMVTVIADIWIASIGTGSAGTISGLPFTKASTYNQGCYTYYWNALSVSITNLYPWIDTNTVKFHTVGAAATGVNNTINILQNNARVQFTAVYYI